VVCDPASLAKSNAKDFAHAAQIVIGNAMRKQLCGCPSFSEKRTGGFGFELWTIEG
jgi:hypothetical protein